MDLVFIAKLFVTIIVVVLLTLVAERVSPRVAGILSGYPLGAAIALFFIGFEINPRFAADSAVYTMAGLVASLVFVYAYFRVSLVAVKFNVLLSSLAGIGGYLFITWVLHFLTLPRHVAMLIPIGGVVLFIYLFRNIKNVKITDTINLSHKVILLRALLAAAIILVITGAAKTVGSRWAGLFSAFPTTLFPLMLIVHLTYDKIHVHTIIRNFPFGLGSLIVYALSVSVLYPVLGLYWGTLMSFVTATAYLIIYGLWVAQIEKKR